MGVSVRQLPSRRNDFYVFVRSHGTRTSYRIGQDRTEAQKFAATLRQQLASGKGIASTKPRRSGDQMLLAPYFERWLAGHAKLYCKTSTYKGYVTAWQRYIKPPLGAKAIGDITRDDVRTLAEAMLATKSRDYTKATLAPLSAVFNRAVEDGLLTHNPALRILPRPRGDIKRNVRALTKPELARLLDVGQAEYPFFFPLVFLIAMTGLRIGEAVALRPSDLHLEQGFIVVSQNYVDGEITTPKSRKSRRVDLGSALVHVLHTQRALLPPEAAYLFPSAKGTIIDPDNWRKRVWQKIVAQADLPGLHTKDLRHTFASLLIQQGTPLAYIRDQMGHHSIRLTVDTYGHLVPGANREEMEKLSEGLTPNVRSSG